MTRFIVLAFALAACGGGSSSGGGNPGVDGGHGSGSGSGSGGDKVVCSFPPGTGPGGGSGTHCAEYTGDANVLASVHNSCTGGGGSLVDACPSAMLYGCCTTHVGQSGQPGAYTNVLCVYTDAGAQQDMDEMQNCTANGTWSTMLPP